MEANSSCQSLGAKLVEIDTREENEAIVAEIANKGYNEKKMFFWIGLTDQNVEGTWELASSGTNAVYLNWDKSQIGDPEPNDHAGKEDCALLRTEGCKEFEHSAWADFDCSKKVMRITCHTDQHNYFDKTFTMNPLCEFQAGSGKKKAFFSFYRFLILHFSETLHSF